MNKDNEIKLFMTYLKGGRKHWQQNVCVLTNKLEHDITNDNWLNALGAAEAKLEVYDHILELAEICFR